MDKRTHTPDPKQDMSLGQNTRSTVASLCTFLRIENRAKTKRHVFCSKNWILERKLNKNIKSINSLVLRHELLN